MKFLSAVVLGLALVCAASAIAPPVQPTIVPTPTTSKPIDPHGGPTPPPNTPEPTTMAIAGVSLVAAGAYRLLRRR